MREKRWRLGDGEEDKGGNLEEKRQFGQMKGEHQVERGIKSGR